MSVQPLKRAAIVVRDLSRSCDFYENVLGLNVWVQGDGTGNHTFERLLGIEPGSAVRYVILKSGDVMLGMVGLFEISDPAPSQIELAATGSANLGEVALVFQTDDVSAIHAAMLDRGLPILCAPIRLELPHLGVSSLEMTARDPDGVLVNFIQPLL